MSPVVVAIVPAFDREDRVGDTVRALRSVSTVDRVLVVDDGSSDATAEAAAAAGADVLRLPGNRGKGGAVAAGVAAAPDADVFLLIDADLATTAAAADRLLDPVLAGDADLTVGVLPPAGGRGGFGAVKGLAATGIERACGAVVEAPLSGQRAIRAGLLRDLPETYRFGLEVAMTIDAVRAGARLVEVAVPMDHRHTGRGLRGFAHRGRQGLDILRALWPRRTTPRARKALIAAVAVVTLGAVLAGGALAIPDSTPAAQPAERVVVFGVPHLSLDDLSDGRMPTLEQLVREGALAATSVRTLAGRPASAEAYGTLGAGTRVRVRDVAADVAIPVDASLEGSTAGEVVARRTGETPRGQVVVPATAAIVEHSGADVSSEPGALGEALADAGMRTAVVGNADTVESDGNGVVHRPAALAVVDEVGSVDLGEVRAEALLVPDALEPFGVRADVDSTAAAVLEAAAIADVVVVDTGDTDRAAAYQAVSTGLAAEAARLRALSRADAVLERVVAGVGPGTLVLVVGMTPPTREWALTPTVAWGSGVPAGTTLHSASTKRQGLVTLTDVAPTVLDALGAEVPDGMIGQPFRFHDSPPDLDALVEMDAHAASREGVYYPMAVTFIVVQALAYLLAVVVLSQGLGGRVRAPLRFVVLTFAAWPLATFVERAVPGVEELGDGRQALVWLVAVAIAFLAGLARRHPLSPLSWIAGSTVVLLVLDVATGARLQLSSILGYSPHTAARFTGFGNTAFAVLAACAVVTAALHVHHAPRVEEARWTAAGILGVVLVADVWPTLGADVGGVLTMVPVFGLLALALSGRRISWRAAVIAAGATAVVLGVVIGVDLLRPEDARTHLGRFVTGVSDDDGTFLTTIQRKWSTNVGLFGRTIWTWMVPIAMAFAVYVLVIARGWRRLLPQGSALRAGVVGTLFAGLIGWLVNDSGVVVSALVFVYLGPYLTLLAIDRDREPALVPAAIAAERVEGLARPAEPATTAAG